MFQVGDKVEWTSQANGRAKTKVGVVADVIEKGQRPNRERWDRLYRGSGCGYSRTEESFVVLVGNKPYWPRTSALRKAGVV
jgi:hypothetical protein